jgi:perosamine synthetase
MNSPIAAEGGQPVRSRLLPYGRQWLDEDDIAAVAEVLRSDWITQGPARGRFEKMVAGYAGAQHAVAVANGTAALLAACSAAGLKPGDEVITSPMGFVASANAIVLVGAKPVFVDIRPETLNIDPAQIGPSVTHRTKAILPVDFAGNPADLDDIRRLAHEHALLVIEDAAHALGAVYKDRKVGGLSDLTTFSFHPVKHITTGEGGMVLTNSADLCARVARFANHGMLKDPDNERIHGSWYYEVHEPGYNLRITDFQCALGISQLARLDAFVERRRQLARIYDEALEGLEQVELPREAPGARSSYHLYILQLRLERLRASRRTIFDALRAENIGVQVHYLPLHLHPYYARTFGYQRGQFPVAEAYYECSFSIPLFPQMSDDDAADVIAALRKVVGHYAK